MRYSLFYFTHLTDPDKVHELQVVMSTQVYMINRDLAEELESRSFRCEDANRVPTYDPKICFLIRRELLRCIDESNVCGAITNLEYTKIGDAYLVTGEYWQKDFKEAPINPEFIIRANGCRHSAGIKELREIYTIDVRETLCIASFS